jgi:2-oxoglutarate ferredoxin oxidoreductase subunit beta
VAKLSGIGCSSKTPDYFLGASHGFNTVHGRMPSVLTGANLANRDLLYLGVSGDGDSASIGLGQFAHAMRRGVRMAYIVENNGVYGLTKGQFSATADQGSKSKKGVVNSDSPVDLVAHGAAAGRHLRGPRLLGQQGAAGAADQGRDQPWRRRLHRRHQPLRGLQQPPGQHQELRLRARAQRGGEPHRLHQRARGDHRRHTAPGEVVDVRQHDGTLLRLRSLHPDYDPPTATPPWPTCSSTSRAARWSPACCTSTRWPPTCTRR